MRIAAEIFEKATIRGFASDLLSAANDMTCENACVYLEIGMQAGILLIVDMFKNMQKEQCGEDCCTVSQPMQEDIKKVLDILNGESVENDNIKRVCDILKNWEKPKIKQKEAQ